MRTFVEKLQKETMPKIEQIEAGNESILKKALDASHVLGNAFDRLKEFIAAYRFKDEEEEIFFFKEIKPKIFCRLIYYRKLYNIEMNRPMGGVEVQEIYLKKKLEAIQDFNDKIADFYRYYRSGATYLDSVYFIRGKPDTEQYLETFHYELDPLFSTNGDFKVAKILANELLAIHLTKELKYLKREYLKPYIPFPDIRLTWQDNKTDLIELIYAWESKGCFGNVTLTELAGYISNVFNVKIGNFSAAFTEMKIRNNPTPGLDRLKQALLDRMQSWRRKKKK